MNDGDSTPETVTDFLGEVARVVPSVPRSARFCFGWNGYEWYRHRGEYVAVRNNRLQTTL